MALNPRQPSNLRYWASLCPGTGTYVSCSEVRCSRTGERPHPLPFPLSLPGLEKGRSHASAQTPPLPLSLGTLHEKF